MGIGLSNLLTFIHVLGKSIDDLSSRSSVKKGHGTPHDSLEHLAMKSGGAFKQGQGHTEAFNQTNNNQYDETHTMDQLKPFNKAVEGLGTI